MTAPNSNYSDLIATTLEYRGPEVVDNVTNNNAALAWIKSNGGIKLIGGGHKITFPVAYAQNGNGGWYSGYDPLPVGATEEISAVEFPWKQIAVPVVASGLETDIQNVGKEQVFDLLAEKIKNAERTMSNIISGTTGIFGDGTGAGGKALTGLLAVCDSTPLTTSYGGIDKANATWWRNKFTDTGADPDKATIQGIWNTMYYSLVRGADKPDLIIVDANVMGAFEASLQTNQRFTDPGLAKLGFENIKYKSAPVVMDGNCTTKNAFFLNTKYLRLRYAAKRNMVPLKTRYAFNQDAQVVILAWAGNLTCNNLSLQGRIEHAA